ncbi:MAG: hypothetical protein Kow0026_25960 [Oricola sp.]
MTRNEQEIANAAAKLAVKETFAKLGVDVDKPEQVEEFRRDLRWAGDWRRNQAKGVTALIVTTILAIGGAFWAGLKMKFGG